MKIDSIKRLIQNGESENIEFKEFSNRFNSHILAKVMYPSAVEHIFY